MLLLVGKEIPFEWLVTRAFPLIPLVYSAAVAVVEPISPL